MSDKFMKALYEWSMRYQTGIPDPNVRTLSEEDCKWLYEALKAQFVDGATLLRICFDSLAGLTAEEQVYVFETLEDLLENIDNAYFLTPMKKWPTMIEYMNVDDGEVRHAAQRAAGAALNSCNAAIDEAVRCGIYSAIRVEPTCFGVVSALLKDNKQCVTVRPGILTEFSRLPQCAARVKFVSDFLASKIDVEEVGDDIKDAWRAQLL